MDRIWHPHGNSTLPKENRHLGNYSIKLSRLVFFNLEDFLGPFQCPEHGCVSSGEGGLPELRSPKICMTPLRPNDP